MTEKNIKGFLIGLADQKTPKHEAESLLRELEALTRTLDIETAGRELVTVKETHPKFLLGTGKAAELAEKAGELGADCLIFDCLLSPAQQKNWENLTDIPALDRQELIIRIFAERALTREAELQVRLAECSYFLPRLTHKYIDLSRQRGGRYGTRGAGETRLETDRRLLRKRIQKLEKELENIRKQRQVQRNLREKRDLPVCAIVGYTNAGKSSLFKTLTGTEARTENRPFVTLDAASRRFERPGNRPILLVDTVGFIRKLPHALIDAFRATLEEATLADLLIHVLDISDNDAGAFYTATLKVLDELGAGDIPRITALNKTDRLEQTGRTTDEAAARFPGGIPVSARTGTGLDRLAAMIDEALSGTVRRFLFPPDRTDLVSFLYRESQVLSENYEDKGIAVEARVNDRIAGILKPFTNP